MEEIKKSLEARMRKIDEHNQLRQSEPFREQEVRLHRLMDGAVQGLQACWLMSTRSSALSDHMLAFRFIDDTIFSVVGIALQIKGGTHNPAKREMRYLLESVAKHFYVDTVLCPGNSTLEKRLDVLENEVPRSSISFSNELNVFALDEAKSVELSAEISGLYSQFSSFVHRSRDQIDIYLSSISRGFSPAFESIEEFRKVNKEFARLCDIILLLNFSSLGSGLCGDLFVNHFDEEIKWPYHKTKYMKILSAHFDYKHERSTK